MKKIVYAMLTAVALSGMRAEAQIMPTTPELIMPNMAASVVRHPIKTSAYSYGGVTFPSGGGYVQADLEVFSFNGANMVEVGIGWIRHNVTGGPSVDEGFIELPSYKTQVNVGILQDPDMSVWVIAAYYNTNTNVAQYDLYKWTTTGLPTTPDYTVPMPFLAIPSPAAPVPFRRISMDCFGMRRAVIVWNIEPVEAGYPGGMFIRGIETGSDAPFTTSSSNTLRIDGSAEAYLGEADVAMGRNANVVRIAYMDRNPTALPNKDIHVKSVPFLSIMTAPAFDLTLPTTDVAGGILSTSIFDGPQAGHIRIDSPDEDYGEDPWSMVYLKGGNIVTQVTKMSATSPLNQDPIHFPSLDVGLNCMPVIAYSFEARYINVGWYSNIARRYVGTRRSIDGLSNLGGPQYFVLNNTSAVMDCSQTARLAFSKNNTYKPGLFMAYPIQEEFSMYGDMRSKTSKWAMGPSDWPMPFSAMIDMGDKSHISINPNPSSGEAYLSISEYNGYALDVALYDITGKLLHSIKNRNLDQANSELSLKITNLSPGTYFLNVVGNDEVTPISFYKL